MSSKRKKSKNKIRAKSSLGISRKKNYTKNSPIIKDNDDDQISSELTGNDSIEQTIQNSETNLSYPYLKREILQIGSTFTLIILLLMGFAFFI